MKVKWLLLLIMVGCSHGAKVDSLPGASKVKEVIFKEPIRLEISKTKGHVDVLKYRYISTKSTSDARKIKVKREEFVDFTTKSTVIEVLPNGNIRYRIQTLQKEGAVELNDLSFPELNESIDFILTPSAHVLKAGGYSSESIFFVQPIPLPSTPVSKGDTWTLEHTWLSRHNALPLKIDMVSILTQFVECGDKDQCADIEISGRVTLPPGMIRGSLESRVYGRILFAVKKGMIVWSEIRTEEKLKTAEERVEIESCMESVVELPKNYKWPYKDKPNCSPKQEFSNQIPGA
ncbi:MAG: hypothetical protein AB7F59_05545 [Bdellovibrionales bacterium]